MKVYVVVLDFAYSSTDIHGVFTDIQSAIECAKNIYIDFEDDRVYVYEIECDKEIDIFDKSLIVYTGKRD
jgi:hypothetical protein